MKLKIKICLLLCLVVWSGRLFAQDVRRQQMMDSAVVEYSRSAGSRSALYYGKVQEGHPRTTNHPYLKDAQYAKARLSYYGIIYPEVLLRFDLSRNEMIVQSPGLNHNIVLFPENVDFAELHGQRIIYFRNDSLPGSPSTGYYILLHSGSCRVLEKKTATLQFRGEGSTTEWYYSTDALFYLYKDGVYHIVRTKRGVLKILYPYKKELKRFISANRLRYRLDTEKFLTLTAREYEKLSGS
jgi:hypothetical protein